jgi:hypothetical protein
MGDAHVKEAHPLQWRQTCTKGVAEAQSEGPGRAIPNSPPPANGFRWLTLCASPKCVAFRTKLLDKPCRRHGFPQLLGSRLDMNRIDE